MREPTEAELIAMLQEAEQKALKPSGSEAPIPGSQEAKEALARATMIIEHLKMRLDEVAASRHRTVSRQHGLKLKIERLTMQLNDTAADLCAARGYEAKL